MNLLNGTDYSQRVRIEFGRIHSEYGWKFGKLECAELLDVSSATLDRRMKEGIIKYKKSSNDRNSKVIFFAIDLAEYFADLEN